jgi:hypothetical protein
LSEYSYGDTARAPAQDGTGFNFFQRTSGSGAAEKTFVQAARAYSSRAGPPPLNALGAMPMACVVPQVRSLHPLQTRR